MVKGADQIYAKKEEVNVEFEFPCEPLRGRKILMLRHFVGRGRP